MRKTSLKCVYELAQEDENVIFIGSDLGPGVLDEMKLEFANRFFMEGVSEQHIIGMAAGLAMDGFIPYVNTIATFLTRRCFEQIAVDLCMHDLPVRLIANGGGLVYAPLGPTHLAVEDVSILRTLPNMTIVAVCDAEEMKRLMQKSKDWPHPMYIRLGKGGDKIVSKEEFGFEVGKAIKMRGGEDATIISTGVMTQVALDASEMLQSEGFGIRVIHMHTIKPIDKDIIIEASRQTQCMITIEEHNKDGGLGTAVLETLSEKCPETLIGFSRMGLPDSHADEYGSQASLLDRYGLNADSLASNLRSKLVSMR